MLEKILGSVRGKTVLVPHTPKEGIFQKL